MVAIAFSDITYADNNKSHNSHDLFNTQRAMGTNTIIMMSTSQQILFEQIFILSYCGNFREGNGNPLQYSCLENPMDGGAWQATVPGVAKRRTGLSD